MPIGSSCTDTTIGVSVGTGSIMAHDVVDRFSGHCVGVQRVLVGAEISINAQKCPALVAEEVGPLAVDALVLGVRLQHVMITADKVITDAELAADGIPHRLVTSVILRGETAVDEVSGVDDEVHAVGGSLVDEADVRLFAHLGGATLLGA